MGVGGLGCPEGGVGAGARREGGRRSGSSILAEAVFPPSADRGGAALAARTESPPGPRMTQRWLAFHGLGLLKSEGRPDCQRSCILDPVAGPGPMRPGGRARRTRAESKSINNVARAREEDSDGRNSSTGWCPGGPAGQGFVTHHTRPTKRSTRQEEARTGRARWTGRGTKEYRPR